MFINFLQAFFFRWFNSLEAESDPEPDELDDPNAIGGLYNYRSNEFDAVERPDGNYEIDQFGLDYTGEDLVSERQRQNYGVRELRNNGSRKGRVLNCSSSNMI